MRPGVPGGDIRPGVLGGGVRPTPDGVFGGRPPGGFSGGGSGGAVEPAARDGGGTGHPAVDAALRAMANAVDLPPDDQIAQYEATHRILAETLATIDEG